ncbi:hypothetical protein F4803DRAFT_386793 [Xylaria telfairii]|nr:hypothetical protein F4803DRAFT_386793 [Xylaria telfairii]
MESLVDRSPANGRASANPPARSQTRSACNRCHRQKLRCIKTKGQTSCERCARLKTECHYRSRGRRGTRNDPSNPGPGTWVEPRILAPALGPAIPDMAGVPEDISCDWLSFLNTGMSNSEELGYLNSDPRFSLQSGSGSIVPCQPRAFNESQSIHSLNNHDGDTFEIVPIHQDTIGAVRGSHSPNSYNPYGLYSGYHDNPSRGLGRPVTSTIGRLTSLSMALYECASKLPSIKTCQGVPSAMESSRRGRALLALDEVFRATNEFINVMKNPYPPPETATPTLASYSSPQMEPTLYTPHVLSHQGFITEPTVQPAVIESSHEPVVSAPMQPFQHLDEASVLLFLSCHCQLVEIYKCVFQAMRRCLEGTSAAPHSTAGIILPQLQVGGCGGISSPAVRVDFNGPLLPPATVSMYMSLITTLSSQLWAQVADALRKGGGCDASSNPTPYLGVAGPTWGVAMERTDNIEQTIELVKRML